MDPDAFLARLGERPVADGPGQLWRRIKARHGEPAAAALDAALSGSDQAAKYAAINASLDLALDFALGHSGDLYREWMRRVAGLGLAPRTVLDVGCDFGLLTCFYAELWPQAEVLGVDVSPLALERARELTARLGSRARFAAALPGPVDLAIATRVLGDSGPLELHAAEVIALDRLPAEEIVARLPGFEVVARAELEAHEAGDRQAFPVLRLRAREA